MLIQVLPNEPWGFRVVNSTVGPLYSSVILAWEAGDDNGPLVTAYNVEVFFPFSSHVLFHCYEYNI